MELLYVYLKSVARKIDIGINFSAEYDVSFKNNILHVVKKNVALKKFYAENISAMNLLIGDNGVGKTTIMKIIGENRDERRKSCECWFMLFSDSNNHFYLEGLDYSIINNISKWAKDNYSQPEYSIICDLKNGLISPVDFAVNDDRNKCQILYLPSMTRHYYWTEKKENLNDNDILTLRRFKLNFKLSFLYNFVINQKNEQLFYSKDKKFFFSIKNHFFQLIEGLVFDFQFFENGEVKGNNYSRIQRFILRFIYNTINFICEKNDTTRDELKKIIDDLKLDLRKEQTFDELESSLLIILEYIFVNRPYFGKNGLKEYQEFVDSIKLLDDSNIEDDFSIFLPMNKQEQKYQRIFNSYDALWYDVDAPFYGDTTALLSAYVQGMSSGEEQLLNLISALYNINPTQDNIVILDEPDLSLHPEWSRLLVKDIIDTLKTKEGKYQVLITSHSPLLVSDFLSNNIVRLRKKSSIVYREEVKFGFASNIGEIIIKDFYMDYPMGEFAKEKVKSVLEHIQDEDYVVKNYDYLLSFSEEIGDTVIRTYIINSILKYASKEQRLDQLYKEEIRIKNEIKRLKR